MRTCTRIKQIMKFSYLKLMSRNMNTISDENGQKKEINK